MNTMIFLLGEKSDRLEFGQRAERSQTWLLR